MRHQLIVNILGTDQKGILSEIAGAVSEAQCNILDSRQAIYGREFSLTMIIEGSHQAVTRAELTIPPKCQQLGLLAMIKRTSHHEKQNLDHLYDVEFQGADNPGLLQTVTTFFAERQISISAFRQSTFADAELRQPMVSSKFVVSVPDDVNVEEMKASLDQLFTSLQLTGKVTDKHKGDL
ncbi:ACT domain-containing protein [Alteromonas sp. C1M14]|uniref:glycine cleavage system protein R n=1 Tax=Alteromonas sp. C1M14 TaxID=2841567 RepID=UPI001C08E649|nr:ACT domain-containing protein [Alteromonas sp. C1M14]MBU2976794.1 glycine cleavage system transcriptional repressor [Alteromonas sp. C1M14]